MNRTRALLATFLVFNLLLSAIPIIAFAGSHNEDWSDGPGRIEDDNRNGIDREIYVTLWNLDKETEKSSELAYKVSDEEKNNSELNWKEKANLAESIDFSSRTHPGVVHEWNEDSKHAYENELNKRGGEGTSWVPQKDKDNTKSGAFIHDAYIGLYSIDPSAHIYDSETKNDTIYAKPSGDVAAVIEYRTAPPEDTNPHKQIIWNERNTEIKYHQLSKTPNCNNDNCRLGKDSEDEHVRLLEYGGIANTNVNGDTTLYLEGKIETEWEKKVKVCSEPDDPDGDGIRSSQDDAPKLAEDDDDYEDEDGDPETEDSTNTTETKNSSSSDAHLANPPTDAQYGGIGVSGIQYSHGNNLDGDESCDDWTRAPSLDTVITRSMTLTNSFKVSIKEQPSATVKYAKFPNRYEVYMNTGDDIWTYAELPGKTGVSSGWRIFTSREPSYTSVISYDGNPPADRITPRNPPLRVSVYPDDSGVQAFDEKLGEGPLKPRVKKVSGTEMKTPTLPDSLAFETHSDKTFTNPKTVVLSYPKTTFKPNQPVIIHGVLEGSKVRKDADVRQVHKTVLNATVVNRTDKTVTLQIKLTDKSGNPINTKNRKGYIKVLDKRLQTDSDGNITKQFTTGPSTQNLLVRFKPQPWYKTPSDKRAYTKSQDYIQSNMDIGIRELINILFQSFVIFGGIYMVIQRALLKVFDIDISSPVNAFLGKVVELISYVFEVLLPK